MNRIGRALARRLLSGARTPPVAQTAARFLFLNYETPLGTAALATATFTALKARRPDARITVAASGVTADLLRASPHVDELIVTPHAIIDTLRALRFFLTRIRPRRREFDYVVTDGGNERTRVALLALACGVRRRVGLSLKPELFHTGLIFDRSLSNIANNMRVLDAVGLPGPSVEPQIHFTEADLAKMQALLTEAPVPDGPRIAMVTQTSGGHPNAWFDDRWVALSRRLAEGLDAQLVFVGTAGDRAAIDSLRSALTRPSLSAAGQTDIPQLAALLALCDLVVTIDTGGLHVARAVRTPCVVLGNAAQPDHWWLPPRDDPTYRVLRQDHVPCAVCLRHVCATRECMHENTVDLVEAAVMDQLRRFEPSPKARAERVAARIVPAPAA